MPRGIYTRKGKSAEKTKKKIIAKLQRRVHKIKLPKWEVVENTPDEKVFSPDKKLITANLENNYRNLLDAAGLLAAYMMILQATTPVSPAIARAIKTVLQHKTSE